MIEEKEILNNITPKEKLNIICRARNINKEEYCIDIYKTIRDSNYIDKNEFIGICAYEDEYMDIYDKFCIYIDENILKIFKEELNNKEKEFIKLALECKIDILTIEDL